MKLTELVKITEADDLGGDELNFNLDEPEKDKLEQDKEPGKEKKPKKDKKKGVEPETADGTEDEHRHPDDFKEEILKLFQSAKLQAFEKAAAVQVRPAQEGEEIAVDFPGEFKKPRVAAKDEYVVRDMQDPTKMKVVTKQELEREYTADTTEQQPDAEGFLKYIPQGQVMAFQYNEHEPLKLKDDNGRKITIKFGDYLGYPADDSSELIRLDKAHFEKSYRLAK